ncbi:hypothetical protein TGVAND_292190A, partial [Toxoplasma gondii VAND]
PRGVFTFPFPAVSDQLALTRKTSPSLALLQASEEAQTNGEPAGETPRESFFQSSSGDSPEAGSALTVDGTFLTAALKHRLSLADQLPLLLGGQCSIRETNASKPRDP